MKFHALIILVLLLVVLPLAQAQEGTRTDGSPFAAFSAQCNEITAVSYHQWADTQSQEYAWENQRYLLDPAVLVSMQYEPGIYTDNPPSFNRTFVDRNRDGFADKASSLQMTACGDMYVAQGFYTQEGDILLIVETLPRGIIEQTDVCSGSLCGRHRVNIFYVSLAEWRRVTRYHAGEAR